MAATSGGPKGGWPPGQRSWLRATPAQAASRPAWLSAARSPAPRHRWTVWRGWPHRPPQRCPAIQSGSRPWRPAPARASPGLPPATGAAPHRACAGATCARLDPNRLRPKLLSASSSSPSCGSRPLKECLSQPWSAAGDASAFEVVAELADNLLVALGDHGAFPDLLHVGGGFLVAQPELLGCPLAQARVAPGQCPEAHILVMHEHPLERLLAIIKGGHRTLPPTHVEL